MHINLSKTKVLHSDGYSFWVSEDKETAKGISSKMLSGYHGSLKDVFESYIEHSVRGSDAKTIGELVKDIDTLKEEIRAWKDLPDLHDVKRWKKK